VRYGQYGGILDDRFSEIFHDCGSEYYNQFITLRDFSALSRTLELGYADAKIYSSQILNEYKLISLQQAIYKQLSNTSDVKSLMQSYFNFLREILIKEKSKNADLIGAFLDVMLKVSRYINAADLIFVFIKHSCDFMDILIFIGW